MPPGFEPHFRQSPVTNPWEPLFSRRRSDGIDLLLVVRESHCNSRGFLHGGVLASLCDNIMGLSLGVVLDKPGANIVTTNLSVDYLGAAKISERIVITPRVVRAGSRLGVCDALVHCGDRIVARANATFSVRLAEEHS